MAKILIIDDDPDIVQAMHVVLKSKGYEVTSSGDAEDGIAKAKAGKPDIIILDVMLPGKDGFDAARDLKGQAETKDVPIIMLTAVKDKMGFDFKSDAGDENWLPVDDYCDKPISNKELVEKIESLLSKA